MAKTIQERLKGIFAIEDAQQAVEVKETIAVIDFKMVGFSLAGKDYGIDIMNVKEIAKAGQFTYVPNTLPFVLGVYNLRGDIIPILDLRLFFNIPVSADESKKMQNLLILTVGEQTFGVVVDKIDKVVGVSRSKIQPPHPLFGDINIKYISGVVEADRHLYVLLDIARIFNSRMGDEEREKLHTMQTFHKRATEALVRQEPKVLQNGERATASKVSSTKKSSDVPNAEDVTEELLLHEIQASEIPEEETENAELNFVIDSLRTYRKFVVTDVNRSWIEKRFEEWKKERGENKAQLQNAVDADAFLKPFWSRCSDAWWSKEYADTVFKALPDNSAKQIYVWNPGCGKGLESYSLACVMKKKYSATHIRIYAQDIDLLNVSNAPLLSLPDEFVHTWFEPFTAQKANGEYTFTKDIKDSIMFEYHDCQNTNALPTTDVIFARDVLSLLPESVQDSVIADFDEKLKGNGIIIVGDNEELPAASGFVEKQIGGLRVYTKKTN